jgi:cytochrome c-type biogenesis protein
MLSSLPLPLAAFVAGLISFLSPCVLPLVPGYVSMISGAGVDELQEPDAKLRRTILLNSIMFICGFSIVFILLGAAASGVSQILGHNRTLLLKVAGVVIILFGLHLTGILPIKYLYADKRLHDVKTKATAVGAFLVGFAFAFGWTPCIGPILATILTFAAAQATVLKGVLLLAVYSLGLAVPFLLTSLAINRFLSFYTRFRKHLHTVEVISGVLMIAIGILMYRHQFTYIAAWLNKVPIFRAISERFL